MSETELISQRDYWEKRATELAQRVGKHFGFDVGEHSNLNCPVLNALESKWERPAVPDETETSRLLFAAAKIEEAIRYAKTKNSSYGYDEKLLQDIELCAGSLRRQAFMTQQPEGGDQ